MIGDVNQELMTIYGGLMFLTERQWAHGNTLPDKITLFQLPIEDASSDTDDVIVAIAETLIHEVGHYFGLSEEEIDEIEEQYWNGDALDPDEDDEDDEDDDDTPRDDKP